MCQTLLRPSVVATLESPREHFMANMLSVGKRKANIYCRESPSCVSFRTYSQHIRTECFPPPHLR